MDLSEWTDLQGTGISPFLQAYRDSLKVQRDSTLKQLKQTRRNSFANIMSLANKSGVMYSNLPQRSKMQYDTATYMPAMVKAQTGYQTGLDALRNNVTNLWNAIKQYDEQISDLNTYGLNKTS